MRDRGRVYSVTVSSEGGARVALEGGESVIYRSERSYNNLNEKLAIELV